jgi:hypothetical protein
VADAEKGDILEVDPAAKTYQYLNVQVEGPPLRFTNVCTTYKNSISLPFLLLQFYSSLQFFCCVLKKGRGCVEGW